jgi:hypothetical protein
MVIPETVLGWTGSARAMRAALVAETEFVGRCASLPAAIGRAIKSGNSPGKVAGFLYLPLGFAIVRLKYILGALFAGRAGAETTKKQHGPRSAVSHLSKATAAIFVTLALYRLFNGISRTQAVLLVIVGGPMPAPVYVCNALSDVAALMFALPAEKPQRDALVILFLRLHD